MSYSIEQFSADCHDAVAAAPGPQGREQVRQHLEKALADSNFVETHLGPDADAERNILYQDPDFDFCIIAHVYKGPKASRPHDHGPSWAIYGQAKGMTEMTEWKVTTKPEGGAPGIVEPVKKYEMTPGIAVVYNEGDVHSPRRESETRLIRIEGTDMTKVKRDAYKAA
ncbi:MAG: hypothetical protein ACKVG9_00560 [Rhodospirillales bacterium]|jgi:predicted metal-dependent enzyme (double-stranded beta helix superfamily)